MPSQAFAQALLKWYAAHQRRLPWRGVHDPYRVWVSEIMLQQTQVETVIPYYARWMARFPTVQALAAAAEQDVLALWEGLGYYARARNLWRAAQIVVTDYRGQLPSDPDTLRALPGIGRYTAGAIASIAFGRGAAVLDGNVKRVLARVFDLTVDVKSPEGEKELWALAERLLPAKHVGDYNQALMDLGATICAPRNPACLMCPVQAQCEARQLGAQHARPVTAPRAPVPHQVIVTGIMVKRDRVLITQRPEGLLGGLWAFPGFVCEDEEADYAAHLRHTAQAQWGVGLRVGEECLRLKHTFTHLRVTIPVYLCAWRSGRLPTSPAAKWVAPIEIDQFPMGKTDRQIAQAIGREGWLKK
jgi:A/G-specific adenine glycosylase